MKKILTLLSLFIVSGLAATTTTTTPLSPAAQAKHNAQMAEKAKAAQKAKQAAQSLRDSKASESRKPSSDAENALGESNSTPFPHTGVVALRNGTWVGSDDLYNISSNIAVSFELTLPEGKELKIDQLAIKNSIIEQLKKKGINTDVSGTSYQPPLPLFSIQVMVLPIETGDEKGYTAFCGAYLYEPVTLKRVDLDKDVTYQAITWTKETMIATPGDPFKERLTKTIESLTTNFTERYQYFRNLTTK